jgi:methionine-rich copper-binding protein CopC
MTRTSRAARKTLALALLVLAAVALTPSISWANQQVTATSPGNGAALATAPAAVELSVSAAPDPNNSHLAVVDSSGTRMVSGPLWISGQTLRQPMTIPHAGNYTVAYHVGLVDGGQLSGAWHFSIGTGIAPPALDDAARQASTAAVAGHNHSVDPISAGLLGLDGVVLFGVVALLVRRRTPRQPVETTDNPMSP